MECKQCLTVLNMEDLMKCSACQGIYHYLCVGINESEFKKILPMNKCKWKCPTCKQSKKPNNSPRLTSSSGKLHVDSTQPQSLFQTDAKSLISYFDDRLTGLESSINSFKSLITDELKKLSDAVNIWSNKITAVESSIVSVTEGLNELNVEVGRIDGIKLELEECKSKIKEFTEYKDRNDQWVRRSNIQINGIPLKKGENLNQIIKNLAAKCGYTLNIDADVDFVTRVAVKNDTSDHNIRPIIVKMQSRYKKDDFLALLRKIKNCTAKDIGFTGAQGNNRIYFNDHLSAKNKFLLRRAKQIAREKNYTFCWVRNCTIMVRRNEQSPILHIISDESLNKII
ncbi:unnamed protein product [Euphydryas editha]|uniref:PHD-type domain-containing protein n=1 Tax=Euphydryas editha TaxID=104508 RepID=A0AAU9U0X4_EUPED|nr:unnamed protein product [Euphydryas editha]